MAPFYSCFPLLRVVSYCFVSYHFKTVPICFGYFRECRNAVSLLSSRNDLQTMKLHLNFRRPKGESVMAEFSFMGDLILQCHKKG